jgi:hypothetical protein
VSLVVLCLLGGDQSALGFGRAEEERRERTIFEFMPPKQTSPARATRSGGPPGTEAPPPKKKQKKGQTNNTDTSAPVRTEAERDALLGRMEKELAELDASLAATASPVEAGEAGPVLRRDRWVGVCLCESAGRGGAGPSGD